MSEQNRAAGSWTITLEQQEGKVLRIIDLSKDLPQDCSMIEFACKEDTVATVLVLHSNSSTSLMKSHITLAENASLHIVDLLLPGSMPQDDQYSFDQQITLQGKGASAKASTVFVGNKEQKLHLNTSISHQADNTSGELLCRGLLLDAAKVDFTATLIVPEGLKNIETHQDMKCLTQGTNARCHALPTLDIHSDSVVASHGVAIARIEDELQYYLESRGIDSNTAKTILLMGFLSEGLSEVKKISEERFTQIQTQLETELGGCRK